MINMKGIQMTSQTLPAWARAAFVRAMWVAAGEPPEWIAERTDASLRRLGELFGIDEWHALNGEAWRGSLDDMAQIVRSYVVVNDDETPQPEPESGYRIWIKGESSGVSVRVEVTAGAVYPGGRIPLHHLAVRLQEKTAGAITSELGDATCAAVVETWNPASVKLTDSATNGLARRGGWKIGIGYRTWISKEVGEINHLVDLLTATELAGGTLISAPDDWPATRVVEAVTATLRENGLDEVPH